ncbi:Cl-channel protein [Serendipita vermifera]|nr:Cl-channel protein [Serendipita vermifera]
MICRCIWSMSVFVRHFWYWLFANAGDSGSTWRVESCNWLGSKLHLRPDHFMATDIYDNPWPEQSGSHRKNSIESQTKSPTSTNPWASIREQPANGSRLSDGSSSYEDFEETSHLAGESLWQDKFLARPQTYAQRGTIDWQYEEAAERSRQQALNSQRGLRRFLTSFLESSRIWLVLCITGACVGIIGAWLDILVAWLSDLRTGRCKYGFFYNQVACCSGLDAGEICQEWQTWSEYLHIHSIILEGSLQWLAYLSLGVAFAGSAAVLVKSYAPYAFHTGIPEIKAILGGYVFDEFLSPWTFVIKSLGLALSVASGLSLGKEGPLVHVSCCLALLLLRMFKSLERNEAQKRYVLASAAAAGVSVAFGSPLGAVIFGLEELDLFTHQSVIWRAFVTSAIAAVSLQYVDPFGTSKLVLFQVQSNSVWRDFELIPWSFLAVAGGAMGNLLIKLNVQAAIYRHNSFIREWPLVEVAIVAAITAIISYPLIFLRVQSSVLVADLFQECDPSTNFYGLCEGTHTTFVNVFLLLLTAIVKLLLTAWTFGMQVPAGIFLPSITIGAVMGRAVGIIMHSMHQRWPMLWIFNTCPPEPGSQCIFPGFYSVIGAAAMLGGVTRMTVSLVVIVFELTGALSHVLPIMISVFISKFVGDALGKEGIYAAWIQLRGYPAFPNQEYRDQGQNAAVAMIPADKIFCVRAVSTLQELGSMVNSHEFYGFPVVQNGMLIGYVTRERLRHAIAPLLQETQNDSSNSYCTFLRHHDEFEGPDLSDIVDESLMQMRKETPLELVAATFQRMNLRCILFTSRGQFEGLMTKQDIVRFTTPSSYKEALVSSRN